MISLLDLNSIQNLKANHAQTASITLQGGIGMGDVTADVFCQKFNEALKVNTRLTELILDNFSLTDIRLLLPCLAQSRISQVIFLNLTPDAFDFIYHHFYTLFLSGTKRLVKSTDNKNFDFKFGKASDILNAVLKAQRKSIVRFNYSYLQFFDFSFFAQVFRLLSKKNQGINLKDIRLDLIDIDSLKHLFAILPKHITYLDISDNRLYKLGEEKFIDLLVNLPANIEHLILDGNLKFDKDPLMRILQAIPTSVSMLGLGGAGLGCFDIQAACDLISALPISITDLDLNRNNLADLAPNELKILFKSMPKPIKALSLAYNKLYTLGIELIDVLLALPSQVQKLSLAGALNCNESNESNESMMINIIKAIPRHLKVLDISDIELEEFSTQAVKSIFEALPETLVELALVTNVLAKRKDNLARLMKALPVSLTSLDLTHNVFYRLKEEQLCQFLSAIPASITSINLKENELKKSSVMQDFKKARIQLFSLKEACLFSIYNNPQQFTPKQVREKVNEDLIEAVETYSPKIKL